MRKSSALDGSSAVANSEGDPAVPVVLDTDHLSVLQWQEQPACDRLLARLEQLYPDDIATTIVSFHEQVQGWLAYLNRARKPGSVVLAYAKLEAIWRSFLKM